MKQLNAALLGAIKDMGPVEKDGWNHDKGYPFTSNEVIVSASREVLLKHGLVPYSEMLSIELIDEVATRAGAVKRYLVKMGFELFHAESGESRKSCYLAEARNNNDKAILAAITVCQREYFRQLLLIPRGGVDPEADQPQKAQQQQQQRQQQRPAQQRPQQPQRQQQQRPPSQQQRQQPQQKPVQPPQNQQQATSQPQPPQEKVYPNGPGDVGSYKPGPDDVPLDKDQLSRLATEAARKLTARGMRNAIDRIRSVLAEVKQRTGKPLTGNHVKAAEQKLHMELDKEIK